jgi:antitoxin (DNA-binding transcriptional repressor) of toxin-antitoxin stability system
MKTATIRQLRNDFSSVLHWIDCGEEVTVTRRKRPVATIIPPQPERHPPAPLPDFAARLRATYGDRLIKQATVDAVLAENRGAI